MITRMLKLGLTLMVVGMIAALGLGVTYSATRKRIELEDSLAEGKACMTALPGVKSAAEIEEDAALTKKAKEKVPEVQKVLTCGGRYIMVMKSKGYGGPLELAVGIGDKGDVKGISVIYNRETIGLGSKVLTDENLEQFEGKTGEDRLEVGKDVQAVTGATITSKAVTLQVKKALEAYQALR